MNQSGDKKDLSAGTSRFPASARKPWTREKLYFRGDDFFRDVLVAVEKARLSIDLETYIFEKGLLAGRFLSALGRAVARGVRVRLLVDGVGSPDFERDFIARLSALGIHHRVYRSWPVFFSSVLDKLDFFHLWKSLKLANQIFLGGKHRDHRKQFIVDNEKVWLGSFNVSDWHLEKVKRGSAWRDSGVGLWGVRTYVFKLAFHIAWEDRWPRRVREAYRTLLVRWLSRDVRDLPIHMTADRKLRQRFRRELLERVRSAKKRLWAITPYFVPTRPLLKALAEADRRGVDVRLILPGVSDVPMVRWASMTFYPYLLRAGCRLFEYQASILHAKTLVVDDWILIGSSNLDHRSLRKDLEVNIEVQEKQSLRDLQRQFRKDQAGSREVGLEEMARRPWFSRLLSWFFFRFRYWF